MPKSVSTWGRSIRQHFPEYAAIHSRSAPGNYTSQGSVRAARGRVLRRCAPRRGDGGVVEVSAPLPVQTGGLAALERGFPAEMPGENEKQPGQAPKQVPPGWKQWARECSEQLSSARGDGRRVECFAVSGELSRRLGSVGGADRPGCAGGNSTGADQPRYNLRITSGVVVCQCGLFIPSHSSELTEQKLRACLEGSINEHSSHCPHTPEFSVTGGSEEKSSLLMSCLACDTWAVIL
ncbi:RPA-interacting protein isoform X1 [Pongo abelii]|uniref:RPA-interacting protein isoform X1 n=1 Tax=Pongo abelii TaxID=9601 RepID=UPI0023E1AEAD|nr:RPA-interacting protein isoform X1 [Pongo pygmaeus]XP_054392033.1 RPA-interacting protein isoform X1 [Pongo abelii]